MMSFIQTDIQTDRLTDRHTVSHLSPPLVVMVVMQAEPPCPHCSDDMLSVGESPSSLTLLASSLSWLEGPAVFSIHCPGLILFHPLHPNLDIGIQKIFVLIQYKSSQSPTLCNMNIEIVMVGRA